MNDWAMSHESSSAQSNHQIRLERRVAKLEAALIEMKNTLGPGDDAPMLVHSRQGAG